MFERQRTELGLDTPRVWRRMIGFIAAIVAYATIARIAGGGDSGSFAALALGLAGCVLWDRRQQRRRERLIQRFADRLGLTYIGSALPKSFR